MSVRIETLGTGTRNAQTAWLVAVAGLLTVLAVLTLLGRITPDTKVPVFRQPAVTTTFGSTPGPAIKAVANDPYLRVQPSETPIRGGFGAMKASLQEPGFGPNFNMGRACPKCW